MLTLIKVSNYAIIDELEIELDQGLTVMTGETGAGKSILIDAVGLALGDRADASVVRAGTPRAEISLVFDCPADHPALAWLKDKELDQGADCCLRRSVAAEGRSRAFINNQPVNLQDLRTLGSMLIDIHGQHAHQSLMRTAAQRAILDSSGGLTELANSTAEHFSAWRALQSQLQHQADTSADAHARLDLLRFQQQELEDFGPVPGEFESLRNEQQRLSQTDKLKDEVGGALAALYEGDDGSAHAGLAVAARHMDSAAAADDGLTALSRRLTDLEIELRETAADLSRYLDGLEGDPQRLEAIGERLNNAQRLARRHRVDEDRLAEVLSEIEQQIAAVETRGQASEALHKEAAAARDAYLSTARDLSAQRQNSTATLAASVTTELRQLGMPHAEFAITVQQRPESDGTASGLDDVTFLVQFNPGQPHAPLSRAASGGELSRVSLALEVVTTGASDIPTYIFDEVDAGIGGGTAEIVGQALREIGRHHQVLCVTHQPQVASKGTGHFRIAKLTDGSTSRTRIEKLSQQERIDELSRMLGGVEITPATRAHAAEMMQRSERKKA